jgi:tetratricopeptide (TPR) repeat protein
LKIEDKLHILSIIKKSPIPEKKIKQAISGAIFGLIIIALIGCGGDKPEVKIDPAMCNFDSLIAVDMRLMSFREDSTTARMIAECVQDKAGTKYESFWVAVGLGQYAAARKHLDEISPADEKEMPKILSLKALAWYLEDKKDSALVCYDSALAMYPKNNRLWFGRGMALSAMGQQQEALAAFDSALAMKIGDFESWHNRGDVLYELIRPFDAIGSYDSAIFYKSDYGKAYHNRGIVQYMLSDLPDAVASFDSAIMIQHDDYMAWSTRGLVLGALQRFEEAIASLDSSIKIKHDYADAWKNRAAIFGMNKKFEEAKFSIDSALFYAPHDPDVIVIREKILEGLGLNK